MLSQFDHKTFIPRVITNGNAHFYSGTVATKQHAMDNTSEALNHLYTLRLKLNNFMVYPRNSSAHSTAVCFSTRCVIVMEWMLGSTYWG